MVEPAEIVLGAAKVALSARPAAACARFLSSSQHGSSMWKLILVPDCVRRALALW